MHLTCCDGDGYDYIYIHIRVYDVAAGATTHGAHDDDDLPFVGSVWKLATISSQNERCRNGLNGVETIIRHKFAVALSPPRRRLPSVRSRSDDAPRRRYAANGLAC